MSHPLGLLDCLRHLIREFDLFPVIGTDALLATIVLPRSRASTFFGTEDPFRLRQLHLGEPFRKLFRHGFGTSLVSGLDDSLRLWTGDVPGIGSRIGKGRKGRVGIGRRLQVGGGEFESCGSREIKHGELFCDSAWSHCARLGRLVWGLHCGFRFLCGVCATCEIGGERKGLEEAMGWGHAGMGR